MKGTQYWRHPDLAKAIDAKYAGAMKVGIWKKHGRWAFAGGLLLIVVSAVVGKKKKKSKKKKEKEQPEQV